MYNFDVKPNNILISTAEGAHRGAVLTDMGACIHGDIVNSDSQIKVHFTWTYAHPNLTTIVNDPGSIEGGGLKASAQIAPKHGLSRYDLFAFGKTIQELLAQLEEEFRERCYASYGFRFLHLIACLLLDGHNSPAKRESRWSSIVSTHGKRFVSDVALDYPPVLFETHKITTASELVDRLERYNKKYSWERTVPEIDFWQRDLINSVVHSPSCFTPRVAAIFNHECFRRLKSEQQLGWMREVFPGATHDRWTHSLGVFSAVVTYLRSLLADSEVPTFRLLADEHDIEHALVAVTIHDLGQTADVEEACPFIYSHEEHLTSLLDDDHWGRPTLKETIKKHWPNINIDRVLRILRRDADDGTKSDESQSPYRVVDGVAADAISGPIDADKLDYLLRDSVTCGVPYGHGIDVGRFLRSLTVTAKSIRDNRARLALAYKAKGRAAILSVLLARYQMWGAVYWHHTYRCVQAMFVHAAAATFEDEWQGTKQFGTPRFTLGEVRKLFYLRVLVGKTWEDCATIIPRVQVLAKYVVPAPVRKEPALDFIWRFANEGIKQVIELLARRQLYKRVFEMRLGELGTRADYSAMKSALTPAQRMKKAKILQERLLDTVDNSMRERGPSASVAEDAAREVLGDLRKQQLPLVLIDFPVRGVPNDKNTPAEIGDALRKYFVLPQANGHQVDDVFEVVRQLQQRMATVRIFAFPALHELIIRYLNPKEVKDCVEQVIEQLKTTE
jgi:HD superfamily phosphohydrolase